MSSGSCSETGANDSFMLFGVRVRVDHMRKSVSMNNLSQYELPQESSNAADVAADCASADEAIHNQSSGSRERKRGVPWTEEEHKLFLLGLQKVGKGDWRGISRNFVKTRTPTQVASHAQKYFLRRTNLNRRRRRSSLFDITTESVTPIPMEEERLHQGSNTQPLLPPSTQLPPPETSNIGGSQVLPFPVNMRPVLVPGPVLVPVQIDNPTEKLSLGQVDLLNHEPMRLVRPIPVLPITSGTTMVNWNLNKKSAVDPLPMPLSLKLSLSSDQSHMSRHSAFQVMPSFNNADSVISVA
ncbi:transcription factor MYB1R1-like [Rhododendron vialii]|uniref:transcription factor MYB1R1-like n=1 Tax=Rhododendron vialii TaxID=182163 RepID=UPI00265EA2CC|nr:transcription factor MYB1R1-like [Rhododendron vialii]